MRLHTHTLPKHTFPQIVLTNVNDDHDRLDDSDGIGDFDSINDGNFDRNTYIDGFTAIVDRVALRGRTVAFAGAIGIAVARLDRSNDAFTHADPVTHNNAHTDDGLDGKYVTSAHAVVCANTEPHVRRFNVAFTLGKGEMTNCTV